MIDPAEMTYDTDRWGYRKGARFVGPREWLHGLPQQWTVLTAHMDAYTEGMAAAAADDGTILDYRVNEWYEGPLSDVLRNDHDKATWKLKYDRFVAMLGSGYLATRGNGDTTDRRLTLPA
jgi:hypothetical protein